MTAVFDSDGSSLQGTFHDDDGFPTDFGFLIPVLLHDSVCGSACRIFVEQIRIGQGQNICLPELTFGRDL